MSGAVIFFWISFSLLAYSYFGYGVLLFLLNKIKKLITSSKPKDLVGDRIPVTLIVAAYNESEILSAKIKNTLSLCYPSDLLRIIFVTDGSTDGSDQVVKQHPTITLFHQSERRGKFAAIKRVMQFVETPVVIFSDANTMLNERSIQHIVAHYSDPKVGGVAGEKKILHNRHTSTIGEVENLYWKYESFMKKQDADLYTVVGAAGELFSIRTELFNELNDNIILDDFITSMRVCLKGLKVAYEPNAFAIETPSTSLQEEEKRKVRIAAGAFQSILYLSDALNFFKHPLLAFQYLSRRLLRWFVCPLMLLMLLLTNIFIVRIGPANNFFEWVLYMQLLFYFLAMSGWVFVRSGWHAGILNVPFYFVFMHYCLVKGFVIFLQGRHTVLWKKSLRQVLQTSTE